MPPLTFSVDSDEPLGQNQWNRALGFTAPLMESIVQSKSKMQDWVDREKAKLDSRAESYRLTLVEQERIINSQVEELAIVQQERGIGNGASSDDDNDENRPKNIAVQTKSLEEQSANIQIEIMKLKTERDNRETRVQSKFIDSLLWESMMQCFG
jgi:hypothetical protein